ncbi:NfeD family protein [Candidatus Poriferisocius sp.]|uniref:NfeD family protein n=1 Tax=Candidatus Poriferisocius sp. TaxID=3101276 RepID=UPI003B01974D
MILAVACFGGGAVLAGLSPLGAAAEPGGLSGAGVAVVDPARLEQQFTTAAGGLSGAGVAVVVEVTGLLDPVMADLIEDSVADVSAIGAQLLVFRVDSSRAVVPDERLAELAGTIAGSPVPVAVWVGPNGASLGGKVAQLFATADAVGIAPGTRVGDLGPPLPRLARHPVAWVNQEPIRHEELGWRRLISEGVIACERFTMDKLRGLYAQAGIPFDPDTVRVPPEEEQCVAPLIGDFLVDLDHLGFKSALVEVDGQPRLEPLTQVQFRGLSLSHQLFHTVASPPVAYLLLVIGMGLMLFEFFTAGIGVAGVIGALLFILSSYGLSVLPHNTWALALLAGSMVAFGIDIQTSVPRFWTGAGLTMFAAGTWWLYDGVSMSWIPMVVMTGAMAVAMVSGMPSMVRTRFSTPTIGRDWMIGELGEVVEDVSPDGIVRIRGALWRARVNRATPVTGGDQVRVVEIDGLWLEVEPIEGAARDYREPRR